jgi:hypothetical protein
METELIELRELWDRLLGDPPDSTQFEVWLVSHSPEIVHHGICKVAQKNLSLNRVMETDHRLRYASSVMNNVEGSPRPLVGQEFVGQES